MGCERYKKPSESGIKHCIRFIARNEQCKHLHPRCEPYPCRDNVFCECPGANVSEMGFLRTRTDRFGLRVARDRGLNRSDSPNIRNVNN